MRCDWGKRVFLAVLTACFLFLLYLCAEGRSIIRMRAEVVNPRQNDSLYIERQAGDILYVGGEGKLYGTDLHAMIEGESLTLNDVKNIIVGDAITEIGYDAICRFGGVETIWLGRSVSIADNGSVRECPALKYIYLPPGFKKAGKDFLYECGDCYVVTAGTRKELPKMRNVSKKWILTGIDSYETLSAACDGSLELPDALSQWWPSEEG